jgi:prevent-host-death family protein
VAGSVNVGEAKTHFFKLLARVMQGEEIVITKAGKAIARLIPDYTPVPVRRVPGIDKGKLRIAGDFDKMSQSELAEWYGSGVLPK